MTCGLAPICFDCARFDDLVAGTGFACDAYPGGIPTDILANVVDHHTPFDGDHGLTFVLKVGAADMAAATDVEWHEEKHPRDETGRFNFIHSKITSALEESPFEYHGLRVGGESPEHLKVGTRLKNSRKWVESSPTTRRLGGVSTIGPIRYKGPEAETHRFLRKMKDYAAVFPDGTLLLVGGNEREMGEDLEEYVIKNGTVVSVLGSSKDLIGAKDSMTLATDPPTSESQRRAMFAAAAGHSNLGIPRSVGAEFANADPGGRLPERAAKDMSGGDWRMLRWLLGKFFAEEAKEPEHAEDDETKHDPHTGRFTAGAGANPSSESEHAQQAKWHRGQSDYHYERVKKAQGHFPATAASRAEEAEARQKWGQHANAARYHREKSGVETKAQRYNRAGFPIGSDDRRFAAAEAGDALVPWQENQHPRGPEGKFVYHSTPIKNKGGIARSGLLPMSSVKSDKTRSGWTRMHDPEKGAIYFTDVEGASESYGGEEGGAHYRIPVKHLPRDKTRIETSYGVASPLRGSEHGRIIQVKGHHFAPELLEIKRGDKWVPLKRGGWVGEDDTPSNAAGVAFMTEDGRALFLKRSGHDHAGEWAFPGGMSEKGEGSEDCAKREAFEEVGDCGFDGMRMMDRRRSADGVDFATYAVPVKDTFRPHLNDEHVDYRWAPLDAPPEPLHPGVKASLDELRRRAEAADFEESKHERDAGRREGEDVWSDEARAAAAEARRAKSYSQRQELAHKHLTGKGYTYKEHQGSGTHLYEHPSGKKAWVSPTMMSEHDPHHQPKRIAAPGKPKYTSPFTHTYLDQMRGEDASADPSGELSETTRERIGEPGSEKREDMPPDAFLGPHETYPVKEKRDGKWEYTRNLLLAAARRARMQGRSDIARRADAIRAREFLGAEKAAKDAEFEESRHKRDEGGRFSSSPGGHTFHGTNRSSAGEHLRHLREKGHEGAKIVTHEIQPERAHPTAVPWWNGGPKPPLAHTHMVHHGYPRAKDAGLPPGQNQVKITRQIDTLPMTRAAMRDGGSVGKGEGQERMSRAVKSGTGLANVVQDEALAFDSCFGEPFEIPP